MLALRSGARVLRSVGVPANATCVADTLHRTGLVGTRETLPHSDTIYNSDEVACVLDATGRQTWHEPTLFTLGSHFSGVSGSVFPQQLATTSVASGLSEADLATARRRLVHFTSAAQAWKPPEDASGEDAPGAGKQAQKYPWIIYRTSAGQAQAQDHSTRSSEHEGKEERGPRKWAAKGVMGRGLREQRRQERHHHITRARRRDVRQMGLEHRVLSY